MNLHRVQPAEVTPGFCCDVAQLHTLKSLDLRMASSLPERAAAPVELAEAILAH